MDFLAKWFRSVGDPCGIEEQTNLRVETSSAFAWEGISLKMLDQRIYFGVCARSRIPGAFERSLQQGPVHDGFVEADNNCNPGTNGQ
tara:strand:- start:256 stop:516 length:261 start_codon:yes stop_codon:yes gene_type:complete